MSTLPDLFNITGIQFIKDDQYIANKQCFMTFIVKAGLKEIGWLKVGIGNYDGRLKVNANLILEMDDTDYIEDRDSFTGLLMNTLHKLSSCDMIELRVPWIDTIYFDFFDGTNVSVSPAVPDS